MRSVLDTFSSADLPHSSAYLPLEMSTAHQPQEQVVSTVDKV